MWTVYNLENRKNQRKHLRNNTTEPKKLFWQKIKNSKIGFKFRRQHGIKQYIVNFYCPKLKLVIELV